jgi:transcriptional regulator
MKATAPLPVIKGMLDVLVLRALSWAPAHGVEIITWLEQRTGGGLEIEDSAVYQALYRMEGRGLIAADWGVTENNRRARYYRVTARGRTQLAQETRRWVRYAQMMTALLTGAPDASSRAGVK